ncbi:Mobile element protein [Candidatus Enterovibrio escicola]|uniref:Mobile element protein n=1 Tax=Candidatus Enterovibrio escicola TaxID=1927127 RepID=A0A2A5SZI1_9GAMM|nr:transposase [Candidatus Enterovibrio escacola]PCS21268.1 Mobile element protein [Candidatus Enterovibrio escacola]
MGLFYDFKLHLIISDHGGIISVKVMTDHVDDIMPISEIDDELWGCLYGEKSYISGPLERELADKGVTLITGMKKYPKSSILGTVVVSALWSTCWLSFIAYSFQPKTQSIKMTRLYKQAFMQI